MPISLRARVVYRVDAEPIDGGVVTIDGERIVAVGPASEASGAVRDLGDVALFPAFVNAHTHLEFSHLREPLGRAGMPLIEWLPLAIAERSNHAKAVDASLIHGLQESLLAGTCAVGEIATAGAVCYPAEGGIPIVGFLEVIGFSRARADSAFAALGERLTQAQALGHPVGLSPHAPYTVSPALLEKLVRLACEKQLPVAMHLAESEEELELMAAGAGPFRELLEARSMWDAEAIPAGSRPIDYLRRLREAPRSLVIHGNYFQPDEHEFLAANADRMTLVYCPRTHGYFRHPPYPLADLVRRGVRVALGTDSRASNPDLGLLGEVRHVARMHPDVPAAEVLKMATLHGAMALGCDGACGSITPGKLANLIAIPTDSDSLADVLAAKTAPATIWLRGREV
jgi:cytosine/adenosine deaminase-related metal-dependent hydrolase